MAASFPLDPRRKGEASSFDVGFLRLEVLEARAGPV